MNPSPEIPIPQRPSLQQHFVQFTANTLVAVLVTAAFGAAFALLFSEPALGGAGKMLLMAGSGWIVLLAIAQVRLSGPHKAEYTAALGRLMRNGVLPLIPITAWVLAGHQGALEIQLALLSVSTSFAFMLFSHFRTNLRLRLHLSWTLLWTASLLGTAAAWFGILCDTSLFL